jgi:RsiW-degrading membrane proteinase PrsW (M82 family)
MGHVLNIVLGLVPVLLLLAGLVLMDSFKLLRPVALAAALAWGGLVAMGNQPLHEWLLDGGMALSTLTRYAAPVTEEIGKIGFIVFLLSRRKIGFLIDAAVLGFAAGTGFAVVENFVFLQALPDAPTALWLVRGLGTATLHGATTAIAAVVAKGFQEQRGLPLPASVACGLALAIVIHSAYNHLLLPPLASTIVLLLALPLVLMAIFDRGEKAASAWVGEGLDLDLERLDALVSQQFNESNFGVYLRELKTRFEGPVVADMVCLLRLQLELSVQARALLMARQAGLELTVDDDLDEATAEMAFLRKSIGTTGLLALKPLQVSTRGSEFHHHLLEQQRRARRSPEAQSRP